MVRRITTTLMVLLLGACATTGGPGSYVEVGGPRWAFARVEAELRAAARAAGRGLAGQELRRGATSSEHVVWVGTREPFHRHDRSDLVGVVLVGEGYLETVSGPVHLEVGDVVRIPRGTPHAYVNTAPEGSLLYAIFTPPFVAGDRVPVAPPTASTAPAGR